MLGVDRHRIAHDFQPGRDYAYFKNVSLKIYFLCTLVYILVWLLAFLLKHKDLQAYHCLYLYRGSFQFKSQNAVMCGDCQSALSLT